MEKGDIVEIYEDPYTRKRLEGKAKLIKLLSSDVSMGEEYWTIQFLNEDEGNTHNRWIKTE
jgi:hypothetical protein